MGNCYHCQYEFQYQGIVARGDECPQCQKDVRVCYNCLFFDEQAARECLENQADLISDKEKANFCGWFKLGRVVSRGEDVSKTRANLEALFSNSLEEPKKEKSHRSLEEQLKNFMKSR